MVRGPRHEADRFAGQLHVRQHRPPGEGLPRRVQGQRRPRRARLPALREDALPDLLRDDGRDEEGGGRLRRSPREESHGGVANRFLRTYFFSARGPTSAPYRLPARSTATPSAALVLVGFSSGSGMNPEMVPSFALPVLMPRFQAPCAGFTEPDSESAT